MIQPGARFGDYELLNQIGTGAFGVVYEANHPRSGQRVALKILRDVRLLDGQDFKRFWLEGQLGLRLRAPGLVPVVDAGHVEGRPYLAMEFVPGQTLAQRLAAGLPSVAEATRWLLDLSDAVGVIHAAGVLHRDLKPANVLLDARNQSPRVTDFGLARDPSLMRSLTQSGEVVGTPTYMAPEQVRSREGLDRRVDVYALGAIYFECLTGRPPHAGATVLELFDQITTTQAPPPSAFRPGLPPGVDAVCARALALDPRERYPDCAALSDALQGALSARPAPPSRTPWIVAGGLLALGLGAGAAFALWSSEPARENPAPSPASSAEPTPPPPDAAALFSAAAELRQLAAAGDPEASTRTRARALAWAPLAREALATRDLEATQLEDLAFVLESAGLELEEALAPALARWSAAQRGPLPEPAFGRLHQLCTTHELGGPLSRLDASAIAALVARGEFREAERLAAEHGAHLRGEDSHATRLQLYFASYGSRSGWSVGPERLSRLCEAVGPSSAIGLTARAYLQGHQARYLRRRAPEKYAAALRESHEAARAAVTLAPDSLPAQLALAQTLSRLEDPGAAEAWARARALGPESVLVPLVGLRTFRRGREQEKRAARDRFLELSRGTRSYVRSANLRDRGWDRVQAQEPGARADLEEAAALRPFEMRVQLGLGVLAARAGDRAEAEALLRLGAALGPEHHRGDSWRGAAELLSELGPEERDRLRALCDPPAPTAFLRGLSPEWQRKLGELYTASSRSLGAKELAELLAKAGLPEAPEPDLAFAFAYFFLGRDLFQQAEAALAHAPQDRSTALLRADLSSRRGRLADAARAYRALSQGDDATALAAQGELALLRDDYPRARSAGEALAALEDPHQAARALVLLGHGVLYEDAGAALVCAAKARALQGDLDVRPLILQGRAGMMLVAENKRARLPGPHFNALPHLAPAGHAAFAGAEGLLDFARRQPHPELFKVADQLLQIALAGQAGPANPRIHVALGTLSFWGARKPDLTLRHWSQALKLDPEVSFPPPDLLSFREASPEGAAELERLRAELQAGR